MRVARKAAVLPVQAVGDRVEIAGAQVFREKSIPPKR
jgi:hypothetical protein